MMIKALANESDYWYYTDLIYQQFEGLMYGYSQAAPTSQVSLLDCSICLPSPSPSSLLPPHLHPSCLLPSIPPASFLPSLLPPSFHPSSLTFLPPASFLPSLLPPSFYPSCLLPSTLPASFLPRSPTSPFLLKYDQTITQLQKKIIHRYLLPKHHDFFNY